MLERTFPIDNPVCFLELITLTGNATLPSISVNGKPVNLSSQQTKDDLSNKTSQLYIDLVDLTQPEVNSMAVYLWMFQCADTHP